MSERMTGKKNPNFGKKFTEEEIQKRLNRFKEHPETKTKISNSLKEYYKKNKTTSAINKSSSKKVKQYDLSGNLLNEFNSISEAARNVGVNVAFLSRTCNKENYTAAGFKWKKY